MEMECISFPFSQLAKVIQLICKMWFSSLVRIKTKAQYTVKEIAICASQFCTDLELKIKKLKSFLQVYIFVYLLMLNKII